MIGLLAATWRDLFTYWEVLVALIFIGVVRLFPDGLAGAAAALARMAGLRVANVIPEKRLDAHEIATIDRRPAQSALLSFRKVEVSQGASTFSTGSISRWEPGSSIVSLARMAPARRRHSTQ